MDGHPAARFELVDPVDGLPYVHWWVDLGDRWLAVSAVADDQSFSGVVVDGLDAIVTSLRVRTVP